MTYYKSTGVLILGSRLRRLSEYYLNELNKVYAAEGIAFDAAWFALFHLMSTEADLSMADIAERLDISHSAVSQLVKSLTQKSLISTENATEDARRRILRFTPLGMELQQRAALVWEALDQAMGSLASENEGFAALLNSLTATEEAFRQLSLSERVLSHLETAQLRNNKHIK